MNKLVPVGSRKFALGLLFLSFCTATAILAILNPTEGFSGINLGTMYGGVSIGVIGIVWGNAQEHRAKQGLG